MVKTNTEGLVMTGFIFQIFQWLYLIWCINGYKEVGRKIPICEFLVFLLTPTVVLFIIGVFQEMFFSNKMKP